MHSRYGFKRTYIERSLPAETGYTIRCSNKGCKYVTAEVFLSECAFFFSRTSVCRKRYRYCKLNVPFSVCKKCSGTDWSPYIMCSECAFAGAKCNSITKRHKMRVVARYVPSMLKAAHEEWWAIRNVDINEGAAAVLSKKPMRFFFSLQLLFLCLGWRVWYLCYLTYQYQ